MQQPVCVHKLFFFDKMAVGSSSVAKQSRTKLVNLCYI